jgi:hypothetical protein
MSLTVIEAQPTGEGIVELLAEVAAAAEAGKVSSIACAVVYRDGSPDWVVSDLPCISTMLGTIDRMHFTILQGTME